MMTRRGLGIATVAAVAVVLTALAVGSALRSPPRAKPVSREETSVKTLLPRTEAGPINDHGRETVDKQRASIAEEAAGVRRSLAVLATAAEKAEEDPGSNAEYLATLRKLQSKYEAQLREATKQETSLPSRQ